jgi:hypothetical protein
VRAAAAKQTDMSCPAKSPWTGPPQCPAHHCHRGLQAFHCRPLPPALIASFQLIALPAGWPCAWQASRQGSYTVKTHWHRGCDQLTQHSTHSKDRQQHDTQTYSLPLLLQGAVTTNRLGCCCRSHNQQTHTQPAEHTLHALFACRHSQASLITALPADQTPSPAHVPEVQTGLPTHRKHKHTTVLRAAPLLWCWQGCCAACGGQPSSCLHNTPAPRHQLSHSPERHSWSPAVSQVHAVSMLVHVTAIGSRHLLLLLHTHAHRLWPAAASRPPLAAVCPLCAAAGACVSVHCTLAAVAAGTPLARCSCTAQPSSKFRHPPCLQLLPVLPQSSLVQSTACPLPDHTQQKSNLPGAAAGVQA